MWTKLLNFIGKYVLGYILNAIADYVYLKIEEQKLKKKTKEKINEIKKNSATKKEAAQRMRDFLNS
jgi:hypothetical protein